MNTLELDPAVQAVTTTGTDILARAKSLKIADALGYKYATDLLQGIKGALKSLEDARTRITKPINDSLKEINEQARNKAAPLVEAEPLIKRAMIAWQDAERARAAAEQARADELARRERERLEEQARRAEAAGKTEKAEAVLQRAAAVVAPVISREPPKMAGISTREVWKFEITNPDLVPREYLVVDEVRIGKYVRAMTNNARIPGVRIYAEKQIAAARA